MDDLALNYEHAFDIRINFDRRWNVGAIADGLSVGYTSVGADCAVTGPLLRGKLVDHSGADWPLIRADGVLELSAHYMIEASDGALIYIRNQGYLYREPGDDGKSGKQPYFRCTPYFRAPKGPHDWLNRTVVVGVGKRFPKVLDSDPPDYSLFRYYAIR